MGSCAAPLTRTSKWTCGPVAGAGVAGVADDLTLVDRLTRTDRKGGLVSVAGGEPAAVIDAGVVAVATGISGEDYGAALCGSDRGAFWHGDVNSFVVGRTDAAGGASSAEAGGEQAIDRPDQPGRAGGRHRSGGQRAEAGSRGDLLLNLGL